ncbi:hypothetical protein HETIRDRAFT_444343 [Heterobasidion irregulare TC 32-1]|uniref:Uncharacterized protein n=1 Tax=Heterobasidion irregulare (strain TC 32-1) TaxID=747525 RepID=W4KG39_HETIT|nr:uncharacterized protein HETIRDRAFT_444343 [Heterobasidion irregulare TC 32-1]ETW84787.1 hypothetical protein HETIRDRAFT_444343 [Heterobasidion irregulare TC 32-1]
MDPPTNGSMSRPTSRPASRRSMSSRSRGSSPRLLTPINIAATTAAMSAVATASSLADTSSTRDMQTNTSRQNNAHAPQHASYALIPTPPPSAHGTSPANPTTGPTFDHEGTGSSSGSGVQQHTPTSASSMNQIPMPSSTPFGNDASWAMKQQQSCPAIGIPQLPPSVLHAAPQHFAQNPHSHPHPPSNAGSSAPSAPQSWNPHVHASVPAFQRAQAPTLVPYQHPHQQQMQQQQHLQQQQLYYQQQSQQSHPEQPHTQQVSYDPWLNHINALTNSRSQLQPSHPFQPPPHARPPQLLPIHTQPQPQPRQSQHQQHSPIQQQHQQQYQQRQQPHAPGPRQRRASGPASLPLVPAPARRASGPTLPAASSPAHTPRPEPASAPGSVTLSSATARSPPASGTAAAPPTPTSSTSTAAPSALPPGHGPGAGASAPAPYRPPTLSDPSLVTFDLLQPTKDFLEKTWGATVSSVSREITAITTSHRALAKERERLLGVCERLDGERRRFEEECRRLRDAWSRSEEGKRQAEEGMRGLMDQLRKGEEDRERLERELEVMRAVGAQSPMDLSSVSPEVWAAARAVVAKEVPQNLVKFVEQATSERRARVQAQMDLVEAKDVLQQLSRTCSCSARALIPAILDTSTATASPTQLRAAIDTDAAAIDSTQSHPSSPATRVRKAVEAEAHVRAEPSAAEMKGAGGVSELNDRPRKRSRVAFEHGDLASDRAVAASASVPASAAVSPVMRAQPASSSRAEDDVKPVLDPAAAASAASLSPTGDEAQVEAALGAMIAEPTTAEAVVPLPDGVGQDAEMGEADEGNANTGAATPSSVASPRTPRRVRLGINHIDLVYATVGEQLMCRMCLHRRQHTDAKLPVASFPLNASGKDLIGHCEESHPAACESLATLRPEEVAEMRQRLGKM